MKGRRAINAKNAAKIKAELDDRGSAPVEPAMIPPRIGPKVWPLDVAKEK